MRQLLLILAALFIFPTIAHAQEDKANPAEDSAVEAEYEYAEPSVANFSKLYWALSKLDINSDLHIDNYMRINECDLYKDYFSNEFEWEGIRASARELIEQKQKSFPIRFEFMQPLRLGEYDLESETFDIMDKYEIDNIRRFEFYAKDINYEFCGTAKHLDGYPKALIVQLSRPFKLDKVKVDKENAEKYIEDKLQIFRGLPAKLQNKENLYDTRTAYIFMKTKVFSYESEEKNQINVYLANVFGALEGFEIYADKEKTHLLYEESFRKKKTISKMEERLRQEYEAKKKRQQEESAAR
jgi:hypothetical protein